MAPLTCPAAVLQPVLTADWAAAGIEESEESEVCAALRPAPELPCSSPLTGLEICSSQLRGAEAFSLPLRGAEACSSQLRGAEACFRPPHLIRC